MLITTWASLEPDCGYNQLDLVPNQPQKREAREMKVDWEKIETTVAYHPDGHKDVGGFLYRAKVPGGWLIANEDGIAFYPDPKHEWDGNSLP